MKEIRLLIPIAVLLLFIASLGAYSWFNQEEEELIIIRAAQRGDWRPSQNIDELADGMPHIIRVEILPYDEWYEHRDLAWRPSQEEIERRWPDGNVPVFASAYRAFTLNRAKVIEVFKGTAQAGDIIDISQWGGRTGNQMFIPYDRIVFEPGDDLVIFLGRSSSRENLYNLGNTPVQSVYRFPASSREKDTDAFSPDVILESIGDPEFALTLTIGDLKRIANESFGAVPE